MGINFSPDTVGAVVRRYGTIFVEEKGQKVRHVDFHAYIKVCCRLFRLVNKFSCYAKGTLVLDYNEFVDVVLTCGKF